MRIVLATILVGGTALLFACGGTDKKTPTPLASVAAATTAASSPTRAAATNTPIPATIVVATPTAAAATIAAPTASAAPPTAEPQATAAAPEATIAAPPPATGGAVTLVALNLEFDTSSLSAAAGPVAVTLDNQDRGIAHNIHFFSKTGSIAMTDIDAGPSTQTLALGTLAPGAYSFKCDVHPITMKGILTVS